MKVFMCKREGGYSGGLAVVAANSAEEAFKTFFENPDNYWMVNKWFSTDDYTQWISDYYPLEKWFECKVLTANVDKACVIIEDGYTE